MIVVSRYDQEIWAGCDVRSLANGYEFAISKRLGHGKERKKN